MPSKKWLLQQRIREYLDLMSEEDKSPRTVKSTEWVLTKAFGSLDGAGREISPGKLGKDDIQYLRRNEFQGTPRYNRWAISILGGFLRRCGNNIVGEMRIGWPEDTRIHANWLEPEEAAAVKEIADGIERVIVHLELDLMMRRIEVLRLAPKDFQGDRVHVLGKGRNGGKPRTVRFHRDTREIIGVWTMERQSMIAEAKRKNPGIEVPGGLLIWHRGSTLSAYHKSGIDNILARLREKAETYYNRAFDFSNHTLRRTGGRRAWKAGVPLETIGQIMGHEDVRTTIKYLGINLDDQGEAMDLIAQYEDSLAFPEKVKIELEPGGSGGPKEI